MSGLGVTVLVASGAALAAVQSHRLSERLRVPTPLLFLVAAAVAAAATDVPVPQQRTAETVVTLALVTILFDGGLHIGRGRFRRAASGIVTLGVVGTFLTTAGVAGLVHVVLGVGWFPSVLVATAVSPTDPAVVFSVLGQREVEGRSGTLLEGESGANDPVGIALMAALLGAGTLTWHAAGDVAGTFTAQMAVGLAVGLLGGRLLLGLMRSPLPGEGLYPVRTLVGAGLLYGTATVAHGSGLLAVFVAGIVLGDERAPYKREVERFHSALASLGEVVAFAVLGLTVDLDVLSRDGVWVPGLAIGLLLAFVVRPVLCWPLLARQRLARGEQAFVLLSGLKGAVPLLLGSMLLTQPAGDRLYGVVTVVVLVSVAVQGSLVPTLARRSGVRMRTLAQEPFAIGLRTQHEPRGAHRVTVEPGAAAEGTQVGDLPGLGEGTWVSLVLRDGALVPVRGDTVLEQGDEVLLLLDGDAGDTEQLQALFRAP